MLRILASLAALAAGGTVSMADFSPRQWTLACRGQWQIGETLLDGDAALMLNGTSAWPTILSGDSDGGMTLVTKGGRRLSFDRVHGDAEYWFVSNRNEPVGMLSGLTGRLLLSTDQGLYRAICEVPFDAPTDIERQEL